jgi:signal transduction histidine kinase
MSLMDEAEFCRTAVQWFSESFEVLSVTAWLIDERKEEIHFGASSHISEKRAGELLTQISSAAESGNEGGGRKDKGAAESVHDRYPSIRKPFSNLIASLAEEREPRDIEKEDELWCEWVRQLNPSQFAHGGPRVCIPLLADKELVGFVVLTDRVSGVPFSVEDYDLLKCASSQVAGSLLKIRLSKQLIQVQEMKAFQTMSTFFIHDLKNTVSTLSLMLENLQLHFDNPEFRDDARRAIAKSVSHLNGLINRLGELRVSATMERTEGDVNEVVRSALSCLDGAPHIKLSHSFPTLPGVVMDPVQIQKVVVNLLLNARDAVGADGEIRVATFRRREWIGILVRDNGCGMTQEFMANSLFRPFQSTKKKGMGIGMFQSQMIVEAHRGRILVDSQAGKGTQFEVLLPLKDGTKGDMNGGIYETQTAGGR